MNFDPKETSQIIPAVIYMVGIFMTGISSAAFHPFLCGQSATFNCFNAGTLLHTRSIRSVRYSGKFPTIGASYHFTTAITDICIQLWIMSTFKMCLETGTMFFLYETTCYVAHVDRCNHICIM